MKQRSVSLSAVLVTSALVAGIFWTEPGPRLVERETSPLAVTVSELRSRDVQPWRTVAGRLVPLRVSDLKFEVSGRVEARRVSNGQQVSAGEVLVEIDDRDYRDALVKVQAEFDLVAAEIERDGQLLTLARRKSGLQEREVARLSDLVKKDLTTRSSLDEAQRVLIGLQSDAARTAHLVSVAEARLDLIRAVRERAERDLGRTRLTAPFAGVVNRIDTEVGNYVGVGQNALTVVDVSELDLLLHVDGEVAATLNVGDHVEIDLPEPAAARVLGRLESLQVDPDPETFTYAARVRVPGAGLRSGIIARARLPQPRRDGVITVPIAAVQYLDGRSYVFAEYDGVVKRIRVSLGARIAEDVIVESGLESGLRVVLHGVDGLTDGQEVIARRGTHLLPFSEGSDGQ